jgi:ankyrin repeat protein
LFSALHFAAYSGNGRIVDLLLQNKADPNLATTAQGWTASHIAAYYGNGEALKALLDYTKTGS